jgi:hypothetical protein
MEMEKDTYHLRLHVYWKETGKAVSLLAEN